MMLTMIFSVILMIMMWFRWYRWFSCVDVNCWKNEKNRAGYDSSPRLAYVGTSAIRHHPLFLNRYCWSSIHVPIWRWFWWGWEISRGTSSKNQRSPRYPVPRLMIFQFLTWYVPWKVMYCFCYALSKSAKKVTIEAIVKKLSRFNFFGRCTASSARVFRKILTVRCGFDSRLLMVHAVWFSAKTRTALSKFLLNPWKISQKPHCTSGAPYVPRLRKVCFTEFKENWISSYLGTGCFISLVFWYRFSWRCANMTSIRVI